jgi:hypothetical protein
MEYFGLAVGAVILLGGIAVVESFYEDGTLRCLYRRVRDDVKAERGLWAKFRE